MLAIFLGGVTALLITGTAMAHLGVGLVDRVDVLARVLGVSSEEVEQAREAGTLPDLLADVTFGEVAEAYQAASTEAIDDAVAAGSITSAQADGLRDLASGSPSLGRFGSSRGEFRALHGLRGVLDVDVTAVYADVLGISVEQVERAKADGTLRDLVEDADRVALTAALVDARDVAIDQALADGEITAEQAELLRGSGFRLGFGRFGHGCRGFGEPNDAPISTDASA